VGKPRAYQSAAPYGKKFDNTGFHQFETLAFRSNARWSRSHSSIQIQKIEIRFYKKKFVQI
jgi:hypothetical protein